MSLSRRIKRRQQGATSAKSQTKKAISKIDPEMLKKLEKASRDLEKALEEKPLPADVVGMISGLMQERPEVLETLNTLRTTELLSLLDPHDQLRALLGAEPDTSVPVIHLGKQSK